MSPPLLLRSLIAGAMIVAPLAAGPGPENAIPELAAASLGELAGALPAPGLIAERVIASGDNEGLPFVVVDEVYEQLYVFDARGELQVLAPAHADEDTIGKLIADNRVVVYVLPEMNPVAGISPTYVRYAARQR